MRDGPVSGRLSSPVIVGVTSRSSHRISDTSHGVTAGPVTGCSVIAGRIGDFNLTPDNIRFRNGGIVSAIGLFQDHPGRGVGTFLGRMNADMIVLIDRETVDDEGYCCDIRGWDAAELSSPGRSGVF